MPIYDPAKGQAPIPKPPPPKPWSTFHGAKGVSAPTIQAPARPRSGGGGRPKGGGGGDPYKEALARQERKEAHAKRAASDRYLKQAAGMQGQITALRNSLSSRGFLKALRQRLANVDIVTRQADANLMDGYRERVGQLRGAASDNEKAAGDSSQQNLMNRARERANAVSEAALQGAGESDQLRSQVMSLRNWAANQAEIDRGYFDTVRSINSSLTDLNVDTKNARLNVAAQGNADRDQAYTDYFNQRSETFTQIGNLFGQRSELYGLANEQVGSKKTRRLRDQAIRRSDSAFMSASRENARIWKNPGVPKRIRNWEGVDDFETPAPAPVGRSIVTDLSEPRKAPEGATLRKWTA